MNSSKTNSISVFSKLDTKIKNCIGATVTQPTGDNNLSFNNTIKKPNMIVPLYIKTINKKSAQHNERKKSCVAVQPVIAFINSCQCLAALACSSSACFFLPSCSLCIRGNA